MKISTGLPTFNTPVDPQGTENQPANAIFHANSKNLTSHTINVSETPIVVKAYGFLNDQSTITVYTVSTEINNIVKSAPMVMNSRTVQLSNKNNTIVIDMTGKYMFVLSDGLGVTTCVYHESGASHWSYGLKAFAQNNGALEFVETITVRPDVTNNEVREFVKLSGDPNNLLQIHHDGLYYGTTPPLSFINQYVSSSTGINGAPNDGSAARPWKSIQYAISNLPQGTFGTIYLKAGDVFSTYLDDPFGAATTPATQVGDVIHGFTYAQVNVKVQAQGFGIGNRAIYVLPYNDPVVDAVNIYNNAHGTNINPYIWAEINFPVIKIPHFQLKDAISGLEVNQFHPAFITLASAGGLSLAAISVTVGQTGTVSPSFVAGCFPAVGTFAMGGGHLLLGNIPLFGDPNGVGNQVFGENNLQVAQAPPFANPNPLFNISGANLVLNTSSAWPRGGGSGIPELPYTYNGDNTEAFLQTRSLWHSMTIYDAKARSYRRVQTDVVIGVSGDEAPWPPAGW